ncbi:MAG: LysR family transcriptional regulator [Hyphomicrobiaceae bacterium TMED74]|nr:LysR family transcriptional regulator [Filomicrobium sp.]RPG46491.1 MAG: LysR family transcriptional regulator [Hyphomicrobiaceae bacterium TMED74]
MRELPFLNGIRAFESAARLGSFKAAAEELNVTPAAISRMVRLLEQRIGVELFERKPNKLVETPAGQAYQNGPTPLLDAISNLTIQVRSLAACEVLTIGVGLTFATRWLIPRLPNFQKLAPDVELRFATGGAAGPFRDDWTCGIEQGVGDFDGYVSHAMVSADLTPVCTPDLAKQLRKLKDLKGQILLRVHHAPNDLRDWLKAVGLTRVEAKVPEFEFYGQALQAAVDGVGVALGIRPYVDDDLAAGRLVAPFKQTISNGKQWHLVYRPDRSDNPAFVTFRDWLLNQAQATQDSR